jgi:hypothetical protein
MLIGEITPVNLFYGEYPVEQDDRLIPSGTAAFNRGAILDIDGVPITAGNVADAESIALEDIDASGSAVPCVVALTGGFNRDSLNAANSSEIVLAAKAPLRKLGIFIKVPAVS